jgi:hypothetical protein
MGLRTVQGKSLSQKKKKQNPNKRPVSMAQVIECLPSMCEVPGSILDTVNNNNNNKVIINTCYFTAIF